MEKRRILAFSHGITGVTGFANQMRGICQLLARSGHEVYAIHREYKGMPIRVRGQPKNLTILPIGKDPLAGDMIPYYLNELEPDILLTLQDIWWGDFLHKGPKTNDWAWLRYFPFDTENALDFWMQSLRNTDLPVAMSRFGKKILDDGKVNSIYIPHGIDTGFFRPPTENERMAARDKYSELGIGEDTFVVSVVSANQVRKKLDRTLEAFAIFASDNKDAKMIMHTSPISEGISGWDVPSLIRNLGLSGKVFISSFANPMYTDALTSQETIRDIYWMSDVHMLLTGGEGFGLPIAESMSCGVTNIATAWTTPKEFFSEEEEKEVEMEDGRKERVRTLTATRGVLIPHVALERHKTGGLWALADTEKAAHALQVLYEKPGANKSFAKPARDFVVEKYSWDVVAPMWRAAVRDYQELRTPLKESRFRFMPQ